MSIAPVLEPAAGGAGAIDATVDMLGNGIHIWQLPPISSQTAFQQCRGLLSADELERADRFRFSEHQDAFIANRGRLRSLLALYLRKPAREIAIGYETQGKPFVADEARHGLSFNLSHTDDFAMVAIAHERKLGIDVEKMKPLADLREIAQLHFSPLEYQSLSLMAAADQLAAFYRCWTRKEAFLKGLGDGLHRELSAFTVQFQSDEPSAIASCAWNPGLCSSWQIQPLKVCAGYTASLAYEGASAIGAAELRTFTWPDREAGR